MSKGIGSSLVQVTRSLVSSAGIPFIQAGMISTERNLDDGTKQGHVSTRIVLPADVKLEFVYGAKGSTRN